MAAKKKVAKSDSSQSDAERTGYHKGALATLSKEREELMRILQIVEQLMQMHIGELKGLGVDLVAEAKKAPKKVKDKKPLASLLG